MKISVVIPTYNYGHYLAFALDSVLAQTRFPEEIIVVDDGSKDNTREVAALYHPNIRYIYQVNAGLSAARNTGTKAATGDWVAYLDSDDGWLPEKLERQQEAILRTPGSVVAYTGALYLDPDGKAIKSEPAPRPEKLWPGLRAHNPLKASSIMAHRQSVLDAGGFNETLRACEDWDMWVRLSFRGSIAGATEPLTMVRLTPQSMSTNVQRMIDNMEAIREESLLHGLTGFSRTIWTRRIRSVAFMHAALTMRESSSPEELRYLIKSFRSWPSPAWHPKRVLGLVRNLIGPSAYSRISSILRPRR